MINKKYLTNLKKLSSFIKKEKSFSFVKKLLKKFGNAELFLVGGAVRDAALGNFEVKDYDFVVRNVSAKELEKFLAKEGSVNLVGRHFGVFKFIPKTKSAKLILEPFDIALPRTEHSTGEGGGYRDFEVQSDPKLPIENDLSRRDFSINALAFDLKNNQLIDLFNGCGDLEAKQIKTVGEAKLRFKEDYSRMLRAIRFSCQLGFAIERKTWTEIKKSISKINSKRDNEKIVPLETIAKEFLKAFYFNPLAAFDLFDKSNVFGQLMPEIYKMKKCPQPRNWHTEGDVWKHTRLALQLLDSIKYKNKFGRQKPSTQIIMAVLFHDLGKPYTLQTPKKDKVDRIRFNNHDTVGARLTAQICQRLKLSSPEQFGIDCDKTTWLIHKHLITVHGQVKEMKNTTIEKYFFNPLWPGDDLIKLLFVDAQATIPRSGKPDLSDFFMLMKRIKILKKLSKEKEKIVPVILNGHEIMEKFQLQPGKLIGELIEMVRENQLSGKIKSKEQAYQLLSQYLAKK